jgi:hypothetical protein
MPKDRSFSNRKESQKERLRFLPAPGGGFGKNGVKGRDERKVRALDTVLPKQTLPYALFTAKTRKRALTKPTLSYTGHSFLWFM